MQGQLRRIAQMPEMAEAAVCLCMGFLFGSEMHTRAREQIYDNPYALSAYTSPAPFLPCPIPFPTLLLLTHLLLLVLKNAA